MSSAVNVHSGPMAIETCYAMHNMGCGYEDGDSVQCELPISHNVDGSWHQAAWQSDTEAVSIRWANDEPTYIAWPRVPGPFDGEMGKRVLEMIRSPSLLLDELPVKSTPVAGQAIMFRKWGSLPLPDQA